jgi:hypothetical protein
MNYFAIVLLVTCEYPTGCQYLDWTIYYVTLLNIASLVNHANHQRELGIYYHNLYTRIIPYAI